MEKNPNKQNGKRHTKYSRACAYSRSKENSIGIYACSNLFGECLGSVEEIVNTSKHVSNQAVVLDDDRCCGILLRRSSPSCEFVEGSLYPLPKHEYI